MRAMSISGIRRAKSPNTIRSTPKDQCPMDRVNRHFAALAPNILWVADITYVKTHAGWVYVAFVTDVYSRRILGWQTSTSLYTDLALDALKMAIWRRRRDGADLTGLIHHSDRGVQYTAIRYGHAPLPTATPSPRSAPRATPTTTRSPRHSTRCIKPNWSETRAPGTPSTTWRSRRPNGSTGTTPSALIPRSTCTPQKNTTTLTPHPRRNRPDPTPPKRQPPQPDETPSTKPRA